MGIRESYNSWANLYDSNQNKTRDLEARAFIETMGSPAFKKCLEIGCGTGKNTSWLLTIAEHITAVDMSEGMLAVAREKIQTPKVNFHHANILDPWTFTEGKYDLVTFSLVLEHIENLNEILKKAAAVMVPGGYLYIGELHPFKQYTGTKANFESPEGIHTVECFIHNISDFIQAAKMNGFIISDLREYFDDNDLASIPRILSLLFIRE